MTQQLHSYVYSAQNENVCSHKRLYVSVHSSVIYKSLKMKTTQMSTNWWMDDKIWFNPYKTSYKK